MASYPFRVTVRAGLAGSVEILTIKSTHCQCQREAGDVKRRKGKVANRSTEEAHGEVSRPCRCPEWVARVSRGWVDEDSSRKRAQSDAERICGDQEPKGWRWRPEGCSVVFNCDL